MNKVVTERKMSVLVGKKTKRKKTKEGEGRSENEEIGNEEEEMIVRKLRNKNNILSSACRPFIVQKEIA
jgi:hypothetical protein